ncbi:ThiJ/PfpI domain protein [Kribbella flavida DSM 17836]|uniref:ThiJ/PfpI domain protein n=1 Tax=Kribbella flavida (strain DSM 17836 / JCM 10339 / NBRC 14399) TaxID=479435 RepID=D2PQY3_KRIFD|nr:DJ-1/PfpI family protein [Kribbella flavida]ADB31116.1 ThiJ/PfpI domain protein [Kribbella flavida DSM 17836]
MRIEIVVFDGVDEMDVMGPFEVWGNAARMGRLELTLVGLDGPVEVTGMNGLQFRATDGLGKTHPDAVCVPGGGWGSRAEKGAWAEVQRGVLPARLAELAPDLSWIGSVCTGSMLLAAAGLTKDRAATTHHTAWADLQETGANLKAHRVVDDGDLITAGGITSGIDLAFWIIERELGADLSTEIAEFMEYHPDRDIWRRETAEQPARDQRVN